MRRSVVGLIAALGFVTSCVHSTPNAGVQGSLTYQGGPPPGVVHNEAGEIIVYVAGGSEVVARQNVKEGQGFKLALTPGTYRLVGWSGDADCTDQMVTVPEDRFVEVEIDCSVM